MKIKILTFTLFALFGVGISLSLYAEKLGLQSLGVPKGAADQIMGDAPSPKGSSGPKNVKMGVVCVDELGRTYRNDEGSEGTSRSRYGDCLEGNPTQNLRENDKNIEMKVDLPLK